MAAYTIATIKKVMETCIQVTLIQKDKLTEIDSSIGDGDMGASMEKAALALKGFIDEYNNDDIGSMLTKSGLLINRAAPSTMGTLISMSLMALGNQWNGKTYLSEEEVVSVPEIISQTIITKGKAKQGDKTVLDALCPFADTMKKVYAATGSVKTAVSQAAFSAEAGMESTKGMQAQAGRARWLSDRNNDCPDGGAFLCAKIAEQFSLDML